MAGIPTVRLVYELFADNPATHGPGKCIGIVFDALKAGWSWYARFPASAFWTLKQSSPTNALIDPLLTHVRVWYVNDSHTTGPILVFAGRVTEPDSSGDDVIWTAYNYLADLSLSITGYRKMYPKAPLGTAATISGKSVKGIVRQEWEQDDATGKFANYGARKQVKSPLAHVGTGTIENPVNGALTLITDSAFGVIDTPRLLLFFDISEMGRANTANNVTYEITRDIVPVFNFWKNKGTFKPNRRLTFPGTIRDYHFVPGFQSMRDWLATVGASTDATGKAEVTAHVQAAIDKYGLRQDVFSIKTLVGYPNIDAVSGQISAQQAITERAVKEAASLGKNLQLDVHVQNLDPFVGWDMEDTLKVEIENGKDHINDHYRMVGIRGTQDQSGYHQSIFVNLPTT